MKIAKLFGLIALVLVAMAGTALAADDYKITKVQVNSVVVTDSTKVQVELGSKLYVQTWMEGLSNDSEDVKVKAWIGGYEHKMLQDVSQTFDLENGVTEYKLLTLDIPEDMNTSNHKYTLHVQVFDENDYVEKSYELYVEAKRHDIKVRDVVVSPSSSLKSGQTMLVKVRLENMGEKKEEDIKVTASLTGLGVSAETYVDELMPWTQDENSSNSNSLYLTVPTNASTGNYKLDVKVTYNRGHSTVSAYKLLHVDATVAETTGVSDSLVSVEASKGDLTVGEEQVYKVLVANLSKSKKAYSVNVTGADSWADVSVSPSMLSVGANETAEFLVKVTAEEKGSHQMTITVSENGSELSQSTVSVNAAKKSPVWGYVLAAVLVLLVLGVIIALATRKDSDAEEETVMY
jgi:hypothetical protein